MLTEKQERDVALLRDAGVPAEWAILMAQRADEDYPDSQYPAHDPADWLMGAFYWGDADEGFDFWNDLHSAMYDLGLKWKT